MKVYKLEQVMSLFFGSSISVFISVFVFVSGISSGLFLEIAMDESEKLAAASFLSQYLFPGTGAPVDYSLLMFTGVGNNLMLILIMMISGMVSIGFPVAYAILMYKGTAFGFLSGLLLESFATDGFKSIFISLIPQNLLLLPCFILATVTARNHALSLRKNVQGQKSKTKNSRYSEPDTDCYFIAYLFIAIAVIISSAIEVFIFHILQV